MQIVVAIPALGLLAGCAFALAVGAAGRSWILLVLLSAASSWAFRCGHSTLLGAMVFAGFFIGGTRLAADAWHAAWRSTLRVAFESIARDARGEAADAGRAAPVDDEAAAIVVGVLEADAAPTAGGAVSLRVRANWMGRVRSVAGAKDPAANPVDGGIALTVAGTMAADHMGRWRAGRTVRVPAQLRRPARYLDAGVPDQERALARRGVSLVGTVKSAALVEVVARGGPAAELAGAARAFARRAIAQSVGRWSERSAGIVSAIVIGDRTGLDADVQRRLQEAGTYHVIAISGGNIAILAGLTLTAFRLAGVFGRTAMLAAVAGLLAYASVVGGGASVDRATCMATVYFLGRAMDLRGSALNALALVAGLLVLKDPLAVVDPAFLLTFGATMAILVAAPLVAVPGRPGWTVPVISMFAASAAAELALLPVAAAFFSRVTFAGLVLNLAAIPLMAVAQVAGMVVVPLFAVAGPLASMAGWVAHAGALGLVRSADVVSLVPQVTWRVAPPAPLVVALYYSAGAVAFTLWRATAMRLVGERCAWLPGAHRLFAAGAVAAALWMLVEPWSFVRMRGDGRLHVTFLDVGQGDAALVRFPRGASMLIDAGGQGGSTGFDVGDRVVAPVLRHQGVRRLALGALSHGDADHGGGLPSTIVEFRPPEVWEGIPVPAATTLQAVRQAAQRVGSRWRNVRDGDRLVVDEVLILVKHPGLPDWERQDVRNDDSVVLELRWREVSVVFTGDIGAATEQRLLASFEPARLRVVKVPHHGSLTSSSRRFVRALAPSAAVISVGRGNRFGHPSPEVLRRYASAGAAIFRTDIDGAVQLDTDGESIELTTFMGRRARFPATATSNQTK